MKFILFFLISTTAFSASKNVDYLFYLKPGNNECNWKLMKIPSKKHKSIHKHAGSCPESIHWNQDKKWAFYISDNQAFVLSWKKRLRAKKLSTFKSTDKSYKSLNYWIDKNSKNLRHLYMQGDSYFVVEKQKRKWIEIQTSKDQKELDKLVEFDNTYFQFSFEQSQACEGDCLLSFTEGKPTLIQKLTDQFENLGNISQYKVNDFRYFYISKSDTSISYSCDPTCAISNKIVDRLPNNPLVTIKDPFIFITDMNSNKGIISFFDHGAKANINLPHVKLSSPFNIKDIIKLLKL